MKVELRRTDRDLNPVTDVTAEEVTTGGTPDLVQESKVAW